MNIAAQLAKAARAYGDRAALIEGTTVRATYAEFAQRAAAIAAALRRDYKLEFGDRVAIAMTNEPVYLEVLYGIWHAGLVAVPINARLHAREFQYILENSGAKLCFASAGLADTIMPLVAETPALETVLCTADPACARLRQGEGMDIQSVPPNTPAWLFYTSGTTGRPKGATLTHRNLLMMILSYFADIDWIDVADTVLLPAPISHGAGLLALPFVARAATSVIPESGHFAPEEIAELIAVHGNASLFAAPTMLMRLIESPALADADLTNLKSIVYGGGPMYIADLKRGLDLLGSRLVQIYGQGESPCTITSLSKAHHADAHHPRYLERLGSAGLPRSDVEVRVVDQDDRPLPPGELGEVVVRGDVVMAGYWDNEEASRTALRGGWLHTRDVGAMDADGFLTLKDRANDMIISGGSNIYPREIEEVLLRHPAVLEVSVVGRPHPEWGEEVVAFAVTRSGREVDAARLDALCLEYIARFKRPRSYVFVDSLPKNNYGKVLKTELRARLKAAER